MELKFDKKMIRRILVGVLGIIVAYWLLHEPERAKSIANSVVSVLAPFVIGGVIAFILNVPMRAIEGKLQWIKKNFLRRLVALVLTLLCAVLILALVVVLLIPELVESIKSLGPRLESAYYSVSTYIKHMLEKYPEINEQVSQYLDIKNYDVSALIKQAIEAIGSGLGFLVPQAFNAVSTVVGGLISGFISVAFAFYTLFQKETLARQGRKVLYALLRENHADYIVKTLRLTNTTFSNFLSGQCVEVCILGTMFAIAMSIFRMPYVPLISVLVAVTAFIPYVGSWTGCIVGAFLILVSNPLQAVWFVVMFLILQGIENNIIYPRVVGNSVGLSGMWVLIAISIGGELLGIVGMFLMVPATSVLYVLVQDAIHKCLGKKEISEEKLQAQPPQIISTRKRMEKKKKEK